MELLLMMMLFTAGCCTITGLPTSDGTFNIIRLTSSDIEWKQPEQVHLSYSAKATEMVVTWVTQSEVNNSFVEYGESALNSRSQAVTTALKNYASMLGLSRTTWMHRAVMTELAPGRRYFYHVGSKDGVSDIFFFDAKPSDVSWSPHILIYGDFGNKNGRATSFIQEEVQTGNVDAVYHIGDFAYDMHDDEGMVGDAFMKQVEPIAAYVPYMTLPGNHESDRNFSQYKNRFTMPGEFESMMYSMGLGPSRIIMFNSEVFYKKEIDPITMYTQYRWLEKTLQEANLPENRAAEPWLIVMAHRPMYCSNADDTNGMCNNVNNPLRVGINNVTRAYSLEDLFYKYGVDLQFYAHEHSYERDWPIYKSKVCNGTKGAYINPDGPIHIITGSPGNQEGQTKFNDKLFPYTAFTTMDYGYTRLRLINGTHLYLEQMSIDKNAAVIDKMLVVQEKHGAGRFACHLK